MLLGLGLKEISVSLFNLEQSVYFRGTAASSHYFQLLWDNHSDVSKNLSTKGRRERNRYVTAQAQAQAHR